MDLTTLCFLGPDVLFPPFRLGLSPLYVLCSVFLEEVLADKSLVTPSSRTIYTPIAKD